MLLQVFSDLFFSISSWAKCIVVASFFFMKQEGFDPYWNFIKQLLTSTGTVLKKGDQETKKVKKKIIAITQMLLAMSQYIWG